MRTRWSRTVVVAIAAVAAVATVDAFVSGSSPDGANAPTRTAESTTAPTATAMTVSNSRCDEVRENEPWIRSCEAEWVRAFVRASGFRVVGQTGSAWIARGRGSRFYIWATDADDAPARRSGYHTIERIRSTVVYTDGTRFGWSARGARVWVEPGPNAYEADPGRPVFVPLVRASTSGPPPPTS